MKEREYTVTEITSNPGIFYEAIGTLRMTETSWKMILYVDLTDFNQAVNIIQHEINTALLRCNSTLICYLYNQRLDAILNKLHRITKYNEHLHGLVGTKIKRAPLEFIGDISKILFGTLTAEDSQHIQEAIKHVENKTDDLATLLVNQTIAARARFGELYNATLKIKTQQNKLYMHLRETAAKATEIATNTRSRLYLESIIENIERAIIEHEIDLNVLIDAILFGKLGKIHPRLITPTKIIETARQIKDRIPHAEFPVTINNEEVEHLIKISKLQVTYTDSKLIYILKIPLLKPGKYKLYRPISLPAKQEFDHSKFAEIVTEAEYIGLHEDVDNFYEFNQGEIKECVNDELTFICPAIFPMRRLHQTSNCHAELLLKHQLETTHCQIILKELKTAYWKILSAPGNWVYSTTQKEQVRIECANFKGQFEIENSGILTVQQGCKVRTNSITMSHPSLRTVKISEHYVPLSNLSIPCLYEPIFEHYKTNLSEIMNEIWISNNSNIEATFSDIITKAREIKNRRLQSDKLTLRNKVTYCLEAVGLFIIVVLLVYRSTWVRDVIAQLRVNRDRRRERQNKGGDKKPPCPAKPERQNKRGDNEIPIPQAANRSTNIDEINYAQY